MPQFSSNIVHNCLYRITNSRILSKITFLRYDNLPVSTSEPLSSNMILTEKLFIMTNVIWLTNFKSTSLLVKNSKLTYVGQSI